MMAAALKASFLVQAAVSSGTAALFKSVSSADR